MLRTLPALDHAAVDNDLYARACSIEGYFTEAEASLLMRAIQSAGHVPTYLEIGSFRGRSTMFALSAMPREGALVVVDAFVYGGHSPAELKVTLADPRVSIHKGTTVDNWTVLSSCRPDVVLIDADHSFAGVALDLALVIAVTPIDGLIATHDVSDRFPGVKLAVDALASRGVLVPVEGVDDLMIWAVRRRPRWLLDPSPEIDWDFPHDMSASVPTIVRLAVGDDAPTP
jgi:predicted O-methyltransferase YrrM